MGIEAIVERGHFYLEGSNTPNLQPIIASWADVFQYNEHVYANKQPGQFLIGSIPYFILHKLGISYKKDYILAGGLVTLFTSVFMSALMMVLIFSIAFNITKKYLYAFLIACFFGFGTIIFPYSGVTHHDIYATFFLLLGFYFLFYRYRVNKSSSIYVVLFAGLCTGFAFFCSFNTTSLILVVFLYLFCHGDWKDILLFTISFLVGLLPSFIFNFITFGNPFNFSIIIYSKSYNIPLGDLSIKSTLLDIPLKIKAYLFSPATAITFYSPIFIISYLGFFLLPRKYFIEKITLPLAFFLQVIQPLLHQGIGGFFGCQYGPRYLLESVPFTLIGLSGFFTEESSISNLIKNFKYLLPAILLIGLISIVINTTGSILGVMYCNYDYAFTNHLSKIISGQNLPSFPFVFVGIACISIACILFFIKYPNKMFQWNT